MAAPYTTVDRCPNCGHTIGNVNLYTADVCTHTAGTFAVFDAANEPEPPKEIKRVPFGMLFPPRPNRKQRRAMAKR